MFKSKESKKGSVNTVNNLLSTYLQMQDKSMLPRQKKNQQLATTIDRISKDTTTVKSLKHDQKKQKIKERKLRSKTIKLNSELKEKIEHLSKLEARDDKTMKNVIKNKVQKIKDLDGMDDELDRLQKDMLDSRRGQNTKQKLKKASLSSKKKNKLELAERAKNGSVAVVGLTPGLAMPGDSDDESSEDEDENENDTNSALDGFKDDFDDYS
ncbi:hypothetical protein DAMA08_009960 [Martiniozyma asiatica (nom. inval.)]|nr:hypothetical protein DAMA08_009960 [Martiniozyma asiatica]